MELTLNLITGIVTVPYTLLLIRVNPNSSKASNYKAGNGFL